VLYPNPTLGGDLFLEGPMDQVELIQIFSLGGKLIVSTIPTGSVMQFELEPGTYLIQVDTPRGRSSSRVVVL